MSTPQKLRAGNSELTRFKVLWRDSLAEDARDYWRQLFISPDQTQAQIRQQLQVKLKIKLDHDSQLNAFRAWELEQRAMDLEAERAEEEERRLMEDHPDWTKDQVREDLIKRFYLRSRATGDTKLGLSTVTADLNIERTGLESRRIQLLEKKAAAYDRAQAALSEAKQSKGGITPETMTKIEQELKLL